jgi:hypothetical protein
VLSTFSNTRLSGTFRRRGGIIEPGVNAS